METVRPVTCKVIENDAYAKILKETFTNTFSSGYLDINGTTLTRRYADMAQDILNFEVYDSDVWVASFPKTGTTWTQEMVWLIANNLNYEGAKEKLDMRFPFLEYSSLTANTWEKQVPEYSVEFARNMRNPRFIKTHLPWDLLPTQIQNGSKKPKIIYVIRNPKDTCLSFYHHVILLHGYKGNFDNFSKLFLAGKVMYGSFWKHAQSFWEHRNEPNMCFIKYEDMKKDLEGVIHKVATFLEKKLTNEQLNKLKNHLSFESMKNNPSVNYEWMMEERSKFSSIKGSFMRSGTVGSYKQRMSPELIEKFNRWTLENTKGTKLFFDE